MSDIDALLKEFDQRKKPVIKENLPQPQKLPMPNLSSFPKNDFSISNNPKGNIPNPNFSLATEQRRTSILKQTTKPPVEQSFDIDAILQGHSIQPQQSSKVSHPVAPTKNSASSIRRDSLTDWLNDDRANTKNHPTQPLNLFSQKVTTNVSNKPAIDLDPDDFFSNTNNRDPSAAKASLSSTKASAKQYYLGNSRYKPGKN
jgi:hypothetical protein